MVNPVRRSDLVTQVAGEELLVFSPAQSRVSCLNSLCARIFLLCDGDHTREQMVASLADLTPDSSARRTAVESALQQLAAQGLLAPGSWAGGPKRRDFLRRAALLPALLTVVVPSPAAALSRRVGPPSGCFTDEECVAAGFALYGAQCETSNNPGFSTCSFMSCLGTFRGRNLNYSSGAGDEHLTDFNNCETTDGSTQYSVDCPTAKENAAIIAGATTDPTKIPYIYRCAPPPGWGAFTTP